MKSDSILKKGSVLVLIAGLIMFCTGYFLPDEVALQGTTFVAGLMGYITYIRVNNWGVEDSVRKSLLIFAITVLISVWASLSLLAACHIFSKLPLCTENRRNGFIILYFFFPMLIGLFSWLSTNWSQPK